VTVDCHSVSERMNVSRCAEWAREVELDPAGTAPRGDVFVVVEHPLPWPSDLAVDPLLATLRDVAEQHVSPGCTVRVQAVVGDADAAARRVVVFAATGPPFTGFSRLEAMGTMEELPDVVASLVGATPQRPATSAVTDILVCTHGRRDPCCGSLGTRLWREMQVTMPEVSIWRTSHTGGHRFAPTAITFPDGNSWARLDAEAVRGIADRTLPAKAAVALLRGCTAFTPAVQVADRAVLAARGWSWLDCARFGEERSPRRVQLCFESPEGAHGGYDVRLTEGRRMPVPDCGTDPAAATKAHAELRVTGMRSWS
jgi:hypothetical protein